MGKEGGKRGSPGSSTPVRFFVARALERKSLRPFFLTITFNHNKNDSALNDVVIVIIIINLTDAITAQANPPPHHNPRQPPTRGRPHRLDALPSRLALRMVWDD